MGGGENFVLGTEELDPKTTPVSVPLDDAIKAVEKIWSVPISLGQLKSRLLRDNFEGRIFWQIDWEGGIVFDSEGNAYNEPLLWACVYADTGEVFLLRDWRNEAKTDNLRDTIKAVALAQPILDLIAIDEAVLMTPPKVYVDKTPSEGPNQSIDYMVKWEQVYEGIPVYQGWVSVYVNPETMKPSGFRNRIIVVEDVNTTPQVTQEDAISTAKNFVSSYLNHYHVEGVIDCQLMICRPNYYWSGGPRKLGAPTLIWFVTLNCTYPTAWTSPVEVWVNAHDASIEGGSTYR